MGSRSDSRDDQTPRKGWKIATRLRLLIAAPLVAVLGFAGIALTTSVRQTQRTTTLGDFVNLGTEAGDLAYAIQRERASAASLLTSPSTAPYVDAFVQQSSKTDTSIRGYQAMRQRLSSLPTRIARILTHIDREIASLPSLRQRIRSATDVSFSSVAFSYRIVIADLLDYRISIAQTNISPEISHDIRAAAALSQAVESSGLQQIAVVRAMASGGLTPVMRHDITTARASFAEASHTFTALAHQSWLTSWEREGSSQDALTTQRLHDTVGRAISGETISIDSNMWMQTMDTWAQSLYGIQRQVDQAVVVKVQEARRAQLWRAGIETGAIAAVVIFTLILTSIVAGQITRHLRRLREAANLVAFKHLPAAVDDLRQSATTTIHPDEIATRYVTAVGDLFSLDSRGADEIHDVARAFTRIHRAAIRTTAEQAIMRANMADIFVHLSRREQRLVDALLAQVDLVERDETDPDRLRQLYDLDNLATRMARVNANLLVLGGVSNGRVRNKDLPLITILQASLSQIQHYTRIKWGIVDQGVVIVAEAVDDVAHVLAELMDNATSYSPPNTEAWVTARFLSDRVIIQIGDEGVGLPAERRSQLNDLLAAPPTIDIATVRSMGLVVVGHLCSRLGSKVELRPGPNLGTVAEVMLPMSVFRHTASIDKPTTAHHGDGDAVATMVPRSSTSEAISDDATVELPIFQQVNRWFRLGEPENCQFSTEKFFDETPQDEAWRTARTLDTPQVDSTTPSGLPQRVPQRHLVPTSPATSDEHNHNNHRDPSLVSAALSAYARGVTKRHCIQTTKTPKVD